MLLVSDITVYIIHVYLVVDFVVFDQSLLQYDAVPVYQPFC